MDPLSVVLVCLTALIILRGIFVLVAGLRTLEACRIKAHDDPKHPCFAQFERQASMANIAVMVFDLRKWENKDFFPVAQCLKCGGENFQPFYRGARVVGKVCEKCETVEYDA